MIVTSDTHRFMIDVGRPSFTTDEQRDFYKRFFNLIETSPYPIVINLNYHMMRDYVHAGKGYLGGGFSFCFWFATKDDRRQFVKDAALIDMKIEDWRDLGFFQDLDKTMHLVFAPKYLMAANDYVADRLLTIRPQVWYGLDGQAITSSRMMVVGPLADLIAMKAYLLDVWLDME